jgi:hypothetical protein
MFYTVLVNGKPLGTYGHPAARYMNLAVSVEDDEPMIFVNAVCLEDDGRYLYEWLQHPIASGDSVEFVQALEAVSAAPLNRYRMRDA